MLGRRFEIARYQSDFYRDKYYKLLRALLISLVIILLLIGAIVYAVIFQPIPDYYGSAANGLIIPMAPKS